MSYFIIGALVGVVIFFFIAKLSRRKQLPTERQDRTRDLG